MSHHTEPKPATASQCESAPVDKIRKKKSSRIVPAARPFMSNFRVEDSNARNLISSACPSDANSSTSASIQNSVLSSTALSHGKSHSRSSSSGSTEDLDASVPKSKRLRSCFSSFSSGFGSSNSPVTYLPGISCALLPPPGSSSSLSSSSSSSSSSQGHSSETCVFRHCTSELAWMTGFQQFGLPACVISARGCIVAVNVAFTLTYGYSVHQLVMCGTPCARITDLFVPDGCHLWEASTPNAEQTAEFSIKTSIRHANTAKRVQIRTKLTFSPVPMPVLDQSCSCLKDEDADIRTTKLLVVLEPLENLAATERVLSFQPVHCTAEELEVGSTVAPIQNSEMNSAHVDDGDG